MLLRLLRHNPGELRDRMLTFAEFQADRLRRPATLTPASLGDFQRQLSQALRGDLESFLGETRLAQIENHVSQAQAELSTKARFGMFHDADFSLARIAYAVCRQLKPAVVVETGVAHGVTTAFVLKALESNQKGELWSIDLPPLADGADDQVGYLVPAQLRSRWHLLRGRTRRLLPGLCAQLPAIDLFLHDSLHTYGNIRREFQTIWPKLRPGGVLLADDVNLNRAFEDFAAGSSVALATVLREEKKPGTFGAMVKAAQRSDAR